MKNNQFTVIMKNCFEFFRSLFRNFAFFFKKRTIGLTLLFAFSIVLEVFSGVMIAKNTDLNKSTTLIEIAQLYKENEHETKSDGTVIQTVPNGVVYPKKLITSDVMAYRLPDYSQSLRTTYPSFTIFDVYQSNWAGLYSPGVVNYLENKDVHISFLMLPRLNTYITAEWQYKIPTLYPNSSSPLTNFRGVSDIFINKEYAQYLLKKYDRPLDDYQFLCNDRNLKSEDREIPYSWNYGNYNDHPAKKISSTYSIKGVLNSDSEEYLKYKNLFGDFFVVNEFFTMPLPSITFFEMKMENRDDERLISTIVNKYKYDASISANGYSQIDWFEYRITFFGKIDSPTSILNIETNPSEYNAMTDKMYDYYANKNSVLPLILYIVINVGTIIGFCFISISLLKKIKYELSCIPNGSIILIFALIAAVAFTLGVVVALVANSLIPSLSATSYKNILGFVIAIVEAIISITYISIISHTQSKKAKIDTNCHSLN